MGGGFTVYTFRNKKTGEKITIDVEDKIEVSLDTLYELIEVVDHMDLLNLIKENYGVHTDIEDFEKDIKEIRAIITNKWREKFTGNLPHLHDE